MNREKEFDPTDERRPMFDWVVWSLIHLVLIGAIAYVGVRVYGSGLGGWVGASAFIAACTSMYLFAKIVPGETFMKVILGLVVAANAGYLVHNGAQAIGVDAYNTAQLKKFEIGMSEAAKATSRRVARELGVNVRAASELEKAFGDGVAVIAALLAFLELSLAIAFFAIASRRVAAVRRQYRTDASAEDKPQRQYLTPPAPSASPATAKNGNFTFPSDPK